MNFIPSVFFVKRVTFVIHTYYLPVGKLQDTVLEFPFLNVGHTLLHISTLVGCTLMFTRTDHMRGRKMMSEVTSLCRLILLTVKFWNVQKIVHGDVKLKVAPVMPSLRVDVQLHTTSPYYDITEGACASTRGAVIM